MDLTSVRPRSCDLRGEFRKVGFPSGRPSSTLVEERSSMSTSMAHFLRTSALVLVSAAQQIANTPRCNTFDSSFSLSADQIRNAAINSSAAQSVDVAIRFERTDWATGSVHSDPFYDAPLDCKKLPPGSLPHVEECTNMALYTLPPNVTMSRILFDSKPFNGVAVPASAYII